MTKAQWKEREQFVEQLVQEFAPLQPVTSMQELHEVKQSIEHTARLLLRHAKTHARLAEMSCNGHPAQGSPTLPIATINRLQDKWDKHIEKREGQIERRIKQLCDAIGCPVTFGGDPRGYTVRVFLPSGRFNSWGGKENGYGVPA